MKEFMSSLRCKYSGFLRWLCDRYWCSIASRSEHFRLA
jgi:hypothetical protein